jgi:hypothetical protein
MQFSEFLTTYFLYQAFEVITWATVGVSIRILLRAASLLTSDTGYGIKLRSDEFLVG